MTIATASSAPHLIGRSLSSIAADQGTSVEEAVVNVLLSTESEVVVFDENISGEQLDSFLKHPLCMVASNGAGFDLAIGAKTANLVHPRCFGSMPHFLAYAEEKRLIPFEKAVHKITGMPAGVLGLHDRGVIKAGAHADLVCLDPKKLRDLTTLENPFQAPLGVRWVVVGGKLALADGELSGISAGRVLRAPG